MEVLVKVSLAVALLLTVSAGSSAQPRAAIDSCADMAVRKGLDVDRPRNLVKSVTLE